jgi:hypothetical protein
LATYGQGSSGTGSVKHLAAVRQ